MRLTWAMWEHYSLLFVLIAFHSMHKVTSCCCLDSEKENFGIFPPGPNFPLCALCLSDKVQWIRAVIQSFGAIAHHQSSSTKVLLFDTILYGWQHCGNDSCSGVRDGLDFTGRAVKTAYRARIYLYLLWRMTRDMFYLFLSSLNHCFLKIVRVRYSGCFWFEQKRMLFLNKYL